MQSQVAVVWRGWTPSRPSPMSSASGLAGSPMERARRRTALAGGPALRNAVGGEEVPLWRRGSGPRGSLHRGRDHLHSSQRLRAKSKSAGRVPPALRTKMRRLRRRNGFDLRAHSRRRGPGQGPPTTLPKLSCRGAPLRSANARGRSPQAHAIAASGRLTTR